MTPEETISDRTERFRTEMSALSLKDSAARREEQLLRLGGALLVVGIVIGIVAFFMGHSTTNALGQRDAIVIAIGGVSVSLAGVALFLRYSLARFFRFWLARLIYEQRHSGDPATDAPTDG